MANSVSYLAPHTLATPPTAAVMQKHQSLLALVTGDNSATSIVITHNWNLTIPSGVILPWFQFMPLLAAFYTGVPFLSAHDANSLTFTNVAFTGAAFQILLQRPFSMLT